MFTLIRRFLFLFDPEKVHYFSMNAFRMLCNIPFFKSYLVKTFSPRDTKPVSVCGIHFKNPVGLAAGFDKNALYLRELEVMGFGFVEIGTVTPLPQSGNEQPRLFRLTADKALINRMGFNNDGADIIEGRLKKWREINSTLIIGGNIGKNKSTSNEDAWKDYEICFHKLHPYVHYFAVNVSSPNTPGLRALQERDSLQKILSNLLVHNAKYNDPKPIFLKVAPDLELTQLDEIISLAIDIRLDGLIIANTTVTRSGLKTTEKELTRIGRGGLSGRPLNRRSTEMINYVRIKSNGALVIMGSGGIFNKKDAQMKMDAGASLLQVWTGFIYGGPSIVKNICKGL